MPLLRNKIATELETGCIEDHDHFSLLSQNQTCNPCGKPVIKKSLSRKECKAVNQVVKKSANQTQSPNSKSTDMLLEQKKAPSGDRECGKITINPPVNNEVCEWEKLNPALQSFFPPDDSFTYVVTEFTSLSTESFPGSPEYAYKAIVRINAISDEDSAAEDDDSQSLYLPTYKRKKIRFEESSL